MENAIVCGEPCLVRAEDISLGPSATSNASRMALQNYYDFMKETRIEFVTSALARNHGDRKQTAASIGLHKASLDRLMRQLGMTDPLE